MELLTILTPLVIGALVIATLHFKGKYEVTNKELNITKTALSKLQLLAHYYKSEEK